MSTWDSGTTSKMNDTGQFEDPKRRTRKVELQCEPSPAKNLPRQPLAAFHAKRS